MAKDTIFKFRISDELLDKVRERAANISEYLRDLIRADINQHPEELRDLPKTPYTYHAKLLEVIDGDTLELDPTHDDYNAILTYGKLLNVELIERGHAKPYDV